MAVNMKSNSSKCLQGWGWGHLCSLGIQINATTMEISMEAPKKINDPAMPFLVIPEGIHANTGQRYLYAHICCDYSR